jgi:uncharacterized protein YecA (UPF0149 family)
MTELPTIRITNAEQEYMDQWRLAMTQRGMTVRNLHALIKAHNDGQKYKLCPCGSNRKYKFCCYPKTKRP